MEFLDKKELVGCQFVDLLRLLLSGLHGFHSQPIREHVALALDLDTALARLWTLGRQMGQSLRVSRLLQLQLASRTRCLLIVICHVVSFHTAFDIADSYRVENLVLVSAS